MEVRITSARPPGSPRLALLSCATLMVLVSATVSACTGTPSSSVPAIFSPSTSSGTATSSASATHTATASASATHPTATPTTTHPTATPTTTHPTTTPSPATTTVSPSPVPTTTTFFPTGAPATGGGGTAGLQDGIVFVLGGAAIAAGLGSLAYRRKFTRRR
jgi:hypothetical protein